MTEDDLYPWQREYLEWARAQPKLPIEQRMLTVAEMMGRHPKAKMSDLLQVVRNLIAMPEIFGKFVDIANKIKNPGYRFTNVDGETTGDLDEDVEYKRACYLVSQYVGWFRMKNQLEDHQTAYQGFGLILLKIAKKQIDFDDVEALQSYLYQPDYVKNYDTGDSK